MVIEFIDIMASCIHLVSTYFSILQGFVWKVRDRADWNDRYEQLLEFKKEVSYGLWTVIGLIDIVC